MNASLQANIDEIIKVRRAATADDADVLADIYMDEVNIAIWKRQLERGLTTAVDEILRADPGLQLSITTRPEDVQHHLSEQLARSLSDSSLLEWLVNDIARVVDMFCCLFDLPRTGLRLTALDRAMCPKFHVDRVPGRLVTTYSGVATQWLPHQYVDRRMLGAGSAGQDDSVSGLYLQDQDIQQLDVGDIALLKGELWEGNEGAGLVHRSPALAAGENRLLLTLDFMY